MYWALISVSELYPSEKYFTMGREVVIPIILHLIFWPLIKGLVILRFCR